MLQIRKNDHCLTQTCHFSQSCHFSSFRQWPEIDSRLKQKASFQVGACPPTLAALLLQVDVLQKLFLSATKCPGDDLTLQNWHFTWCVLIFASSRGLAKKFSNFLRTLHCGHGQPFRALHGNCCRDLSDWKWNSGSLVESGCPTDHLLPIHFRAGPIQSWLWPLQQRQADNDLFGTTI